MKIKLARWRFFLFSFCMLSSINGLHAIALNKELENAVDKLKAMVPTKKNIHDVKKAMDEVFSVRQEVKNASRKGLIKRKDVKFYTKPQSESRKAILMQAAQLMGVVKPEKFTAKAIDGYNKVDEQSKIEMLNKKAEELLDKSTRNYKEDDLRSLLFVKEHVLHFLMYGKNLSSNIKSLLTSLSERISDKLVGEEKVLVVTSSLTPSTASYQTVEGNNKNDKDEKYLDSKNEQSDRSKLMSDIRKGKDLKKSSQESAPKKETLQGQIKQGLKLKTEKDQKPLAPKKSQTKGSLASSLEERRKSITGDEDDDNESGIKIDDIISEKKPAEKPVKKRPAKETLAKRPPKIKTHSSATGSLLGDIKKGVSLQKTEPQEPKAPEISEAQKSFVEKVSTYKEKAQEPKEGSDLEEFEQTEQDWE